MGNVIVGAAMSLDGFVTCSPRLKPGASQATHVLLGHVSA
jgi:hypothetical protein